MSVVCTQALDALLSLLIYVIGICVWARACRRVEVKAGRLFAGVGSLLPMCSSGIKL